jgi:hypothetical protein
LQPKSTFNQEEALFVDYDLVGLIIGKGGQTIKEVSTKYNVKIFVNKEQDDGDKRKILIQATNNEDL